MKLMWCISCEEMVMVEEPIEGHSVIQFVPDEGIQEVFWCSGEFTGCAPDEIDPDFDIQPEPSQAELVMMNLSAELLLQDLGVE